MTPATGIRPALEQCHSRLSGPDRGRPPRAGAEWRSDPRRRARVLRWSTGAIGAVAVSAALGGAGVAQGFIAMLQPTRVAPIAVTVADIASLQELASYGDVSGVPALTLTPVTRATVQSLTGVTPPSPTNLPSGISSTPAYDVLSGDTVAFTFDPAKVKAAAQRIGATLPPMPADIEGSTLQLTIPSVLITSYGVNAGGLIGVAGNSTSSDAGQPQAQSPAAPGTPSSTGGPQTGGGTRQDLVGLLIVTSRLPTVSSTGATTAQIEDYLLAQPGVPAGLAAEIRVIGDPASTLPVPIPVSLASAQRISIDGGQGLLTGDQTGIGSLVLWERDGTMNAVVGSVSSSEALEVARSIG